MMTSIEVNKPNDPTASKGLNADTQNAAAVVKDVKNMVTDARL